MTASIGNASLTSLGATPVVVTTEGSGAIGHIELGSTTDVTFRSARIRSVTMRSSHRTTIEDSTLGGTPTFRVLDQIIFMPDTNTDVTIQRNDIGWTNADNSGNTGYGCRCYGSNTRLRFINNRVHDIAADGFQGVGGVGRADRGERDRSGRREPVLERAFRQHPDHG